MGYATTNDAFSMTSPRTDAAQSLRCMRLALQDAACAPGDLGYINAHGSSTPLNDTYESLAIQRLLDGARVPVSSTKGAHAHALGASGAMELVLSAQVFDKACLPPTLNLTDIAEDCRGIELFSQAREAKVDRVLSNSFGFGGINACVVLGRA
jgi:3-oxoacyl-[acyl-carrier-protein] synthase II